MAKDYIKIVKGRSLKENITLKKKIFQHVLLLVSISEGTTFYSTACWLSPRNVVSGWSKWEVWQRIFKCQIKTSHLLKINVECAKWTPNQEITVWHLVALKRITNRRQFRQLFQYSIPFIHLLRGKLTDITQCIKRTNPYITIF